jgi:hypothetical protein
MPVTLSGPAVSCRRRPSFFGGRYEWTDHQGFDPNRDNRHFWRGGLSDLLGWVGASRVLGRLHARGLFSALPRPRTRTGRLGPARQDDEELQGSHAENCSVRTRLSLSRVLARDEQS